MAKKRTVDLSKAANKKQVDSYSSDTQKSKVESTDSPTPSTGTQYVKKGYVTSEGVKKYRVSIHLTKEQRTRLKELAEDAELTVTDYIVRELGI